MKKISIISYFYIPNFTVILQFVTEIQAISYFHCLQMMTSLAISDYSDYKEIEFFRTIGRTAHGRSYFSLTDQNIRLVIILFSVYLPSVHACKSSSDERLWHLRSLYLLLTRYLISKITF